MILYITIKKHKINKYLLVTYFIINNIFKLLDIIIESNNNDIIEIFFIIINKILLIYICELFYLILKTNLMI